MNLYPAIRTIRAHAHSWTNIGPAGRLQRANCRASRQRGRQPTANAANAIRHCMRNRISRPATNRLPPPTHHQLLRFGRQRPRRCGRRVSDTAAVVVTYDHLIALLQLTASRRAPVSNLIPPLLSSHHHAGVNGWSFYQPCGPLVRELRNLLNNRACEL